VLVVLNGPPAVGKSTLARRYADDHALALVVDVDHLRSRLGQWQTVEASKMLARDLAVALVREHLGAGYDVLVPQYLARPEFIRRLAEVAAGADAAFVEIVLTDDAERITDRFRARRAELARTGVAHPEADLDDDAVEDALRMSNTQLLEDAEKRGALVISAAGGPEAAYRSLSDALGTED
jgi:predicted kinase